MKRNLAVGVAAILVGTAFAVSGCGTHNQSAAGPTGAAAPGVIPANGTEAQQKQAIIQAAEGRRAVVQSPANPQNKPK